MALQFDGPTRSLFVTEVGVYDAADLYSLWKDWVHQAGNAGYPPAFETVGGDPVGGGQAVAPYYFIRNDLGWMIRSPEADGIVTITGNLFPRDPDLAYLLPPLGDYTVLVKQQVSTQAIVVETGISGLTSEESTKLDSLPTADEIWSYERA
jgi:hypothetical protein